MERLTEFEGIDDDGHLKYDVNVSVLLANEEDGKDKLRKLLDKKVQKCIRKLGAIEDLEEEIGMTFEFIYTNIIGEDIYHIYENKEVWEETATGIARTYIRCKHELGEWQIVTDRFWVFKPSEYGKTWWLNREDAEKALEEMKND